MTDVIAFVDALSPRELRGVLHSWKQGEMDAGTPRVTPRVMSSIYTGLDPAENGMMSVSKHGGADTTRPRRSTIIDQCVREGLSVVSMGMPFSIPFQSGNPQSVLHGDALGGQQQVVPEQAGQLVSVPAPTQDMIGDHPDAVFASFHDHTYAYYNRFKETIRRVNPDVAFIGYRLVDSYCHFQHTEKREGRPYRQHLIQDVAHLLDRIESQIDGDLMFFSDHGQTKLTDVFRINKWLEQNDYLSYKVDTDFIEQAREYQQQAEQHPVDERVQNQLTFGQPGVVLDEEESDWICADPFDSCLTMLSDKSEAEPEKLRQDLLDTGLIRDVYFRWEIYDESAQLYETVPHCLPDRDEGVFVSGNVHPEPIGMGYYRTGVHDYKACYGGTTKLDVPEGDGRGGRILPEQMYQVLRDFIGLEITTPPISDEQMQQFTPEEQEIMLDDISNNRLPLKTQPTAVQHTNIGQHTGNNAFMEEE